MADWKKLAHHALLIDGRIDTKETALLEKYVFADGKVDKSELEFLAGLRKGAKEVVQAFNELFFKAVKMAVLSDGKISDAEANFLRKIIFADGKPDAQEKQFVATLKDEAKESSPEFAKLVKDVQAS